MQAGEDRFWRQENPRLGRTIRRSPSPVRRAVVLAVFAAVAVTSVAQAAQGGASSVAFGGAGSGKGIAFSPMKTAGATWYGPGFYGHKTACGQVLRPGTIGVAHRNLPCGTAVKFAYHGHYLITRVIDRGPYTRGNAWDLTNGARTMLGFNSSGRVRYAVARHFARHHTRR
jgi:rare lipoprotein A (peptidoglycan hydrolase)